MQPSAGIQTPEIQTLHVSGGIHATDPKSNTSNDITDLPTHVMVEEYRHKMDFSPLIKPRGHLMDKLLSN